jgi:hypothetical protein
VITGIDNVIEKPTETEIKNWLNDNEKIWRQVIGNTTEIIPVCFRLTGIDTESESLKQLRQISVHAVWQAIEKEAKDNIPVVLPQPKPWCLIV